MRKKKQRSPGRELKTRSQLDSEALSFYPQSGTIVQALVLERLATSHAAGLEREVLDTLARSVLGGDAIDPVFQRVANAVMAKAILSGKLPKKSGRPAELDRGHGLEVALEYFFLKDGGHSYADSMDILTKKYACDERQIARFMKEHKAFIGATPEDRKLGNALFKATQQLDFDFDFSEFNIAKRSNPQEKLTELIGSALKFRLDPATALSDALDRHVNPLMATDKK